MPEPINMTVVFASMDQGEIHLAKHVLEREGIPTHISNENLSRLNPVYGMASGGIRLEVPGKDADRARRLLLAMQETQTPQKTSSPCPDCSKIQAQRTRWFTLITAIAVLFAGIPLLFIRKRGCTRCGKNHWVY